MLLGVEVLSYFFLFVNRRRDVFGGRRDRNGWLANLDGELFEAIPTGVWRGGPCNSLGWGLLWVIDVEESSFHCCC